MSVRAGVFPLRVDEGPPFVTSVHGRGCVFLPAGVHCWDELSDQTVPWADVYDIQVIGPTVIGPLWFLLQGLPGLLSPAVVRDRYTRVMVRRRSVSPTEVHLGTPERAYLYRELDALETALGELGEQGQLHRLSDARFVHALLQQLPKACSWITPITVYHAKRLVRAALSR